MPTEAITQILFQGGMVSVFVIFVLLWSDRMAKSQAERDEAMRKFFAEQRTNDREILQKLVDSVDKVGVALEEHDTKTDVAIATMQERTAQKTTRTRKT